MTIDNGAALKAARESLGLTVRELADRLHLVGHGDVVVREMESGKRPITGPIGVAVELLTLALAMENRRLELKRERETLGLTDREADEFYWLGRFLEGNFG